MKKFIVALMSVIMCMSVGLTAGATLSDYEYVVRDHDYIDNSSGCDYIVMKESRYTISVFYNYENKATAYVCVRNDNIYIDVRRKSFEDIQIRIDNNGEIKATNRTYSLDTADGCVTKTINGKLTYTLLDTNITFYNDAEINGIDSFAKFVEKVIDCSIKEIR